MPVQDIQAAIIPIGHSPASDAFFMIFNQLHLRRNIHRQLDTADIRISLLLRMICFGDPPTATTPETSLTRRDKIKLKITLNNQSQVINGGTCTTIHEDLLDLAKSENFIPFLPSTALDRSSCYYHRTINLPNGLQFPNPGDYMFKLLLQREGIDQDFFVQTVIPIMVYEKA